MTRTTNKYYFIVNPFSSKGSNASKNLNQLLKQTNLDYELIETTEHYNIKDIAIKIQPHLHKKDIIVSVGGDGTISEVIQALNELDISNPLGVIPTGSGNDFARFHKIPTSIKPAFKHLLNVTNAVEHDILVAEADKISYIVNSTGAGIDGRVVHNLHKNRGQSKLGKLAYLRNALKSLFSQNYFDAELEVDGKKLKVHQTIILLFMIQGIFGGGVNMHPKAKSDDGYLDVIFTHNFNVTDLIQILFKLLVSNTHLNHPKVYTVKGKKITVRVNSDEYWQADGENIGNDVQAYTFSTKKQLYWF